MTEALNVDRVEAPARVDHRGLMLHDRERFLEELRETFMNRDVVIAVELDEPKRSNPANRYLFGVVYREIRKANENAHTKEEIHDAMCSMFLTRRVVFVNKQTGESDERDVPGRSRKLKASRFYRFVEEVRAWASGFYGITIPDPDPEYFIERDEALAAEAAREKVPA